MRKKIQDFIGEGQDHDR